MWRADSPSRDQARGEEKPQGWGGPSGQAPERQEALQEGKGLEAERGWGHLSWVRVSWPAGQQNSRRNPAAPPGSASGQEAKSPVRGTGHCRPPGMGPPSSQGTGHNSPSAWAGRPYLRARPEVQWGEPIHCSDPVLSFQFKATNTPHVLAS